ncbi:MAG: hypothetical protein DU480_08715 [Nitrosomonas sp.]|uniref:HupE/UreJ family protein n=1 Tax=Nitrosomonas sp. TaxID=42353 RepID=UPI0032F05A5A
MKKPIPPVKFFPLLLLIALLLITSPLVFAHTGDGPHNGWLHGFTHPLSGLGHMLTIVAGGIGLALLRKKFADARWIRFSGIIIAGSGGFLLIP